MPSLKARCKPLLFRALERSVRVSTRAAGYQAWADRLREIVPDISGQYTSFAVEGDYLEAKVRALHAFQIALVARVLPDIPSPATVVDIGDSSGTHATYLRALYGTSARYVSVNLDATAIEKIRAKGLEAIHARVEDLASHQISADVLLCFESLEHFFDPARFLHDLASKTQAQYLVLTVPFVARSRVGLHHIRHRRTEPVCAENTHLFELSPSDWTLLASHSGWATVYDEVFLQYPSWHPLWFTRPVWKRLDFEGFYGMILRPDPTWSSRFCDW